MRRGAAACCAALFLGACAGPPNDSPQSTGDPVSGGTARVIQLNEPRNLDPAALGNEWILNAFLGNSLYGTLMVNDPKTGKIEYKMAKDFATNDGGATFELKLRPGLKFSDGSPLDAEAVKFNWDRLKDPKTGSQVMEDASMIASSKVVDATTLKVTMVEPVPYFAQAVVPTPMNWIASPQALKAGKQAFDAKPVGAGPFTLKKWARQDTIELVKNPNYWDAPRPYLDRITLRTSGDAHQRINTLISGGADVAMDSNWGTTAKAEDAGFPTYVMPLNGGYFLTMNTRRAPFNDVRARKAVAAALDLDALAMAVHNDKGQPVSTLFGKSSPFYSDKKLAQKNKATAQKLFNELAAEGKPVSVTYPATALTETKATAESVQAQLSSFKNVDVKVKMGDLADLLKKRLTYDFDIMTSSSHFVDPEPRLWTAFHGDSRRNISGIDDKQLNAALEKGRTATTTEGRKAAYEVVQERLIELTPVVFTERTPAIVVTGKNVGGVVAYGNGSLLPEELWIRQ
ncbi:ABC transporter substrate-binding protein [Streptomyces himalayensis]|uniref:ABC transporter substrate-binding protein n=1 Tax=Streptomyces himalayensis TaxID=2820085 RepID=UPI001C6A8873|nr:ABC transporter substrate-binding protein [Streptomyces himalayensis]